MATTKEYLNELNNVKYTQLPNGTYYTQLIYNTVNEMVTNDYISQESKEIAKKIEEKKQMY